MHNCTMSIDIFYRVVEKFLRILNFNNSITNAPERLKFSRYTIYLRGIFVTYSMLYLFTSKNMLSNKCCFCKLYINIWVPNMSLYRKCAIVNMLKIMCSTRYDHQKTWMNLFDTHQKSNHRPPDSNTCMREAPGSTFDEYQWDSFKFSDDRIA